MTETVYIVFLATRYEGQEIMSVHRTQESANKVAREAWEAQWAREDKSFSLKSDGSFCGNATDYTFHVDSFSIKE